MSTNLTPEEKDILRILREAQKPLSLADLGHLVGGNQHIYVITPVNSLMAKGLIILETNTYTGKTYYQEK